MRRLAFPLLVFGLFAMPAPRVCAWNELGHMVVAKVAYDQMDEGLKLRVFNTLKAHPHYEDYLAKNCPEGVGIQEWVLLRAAIWPDWIRFREKTDPRGERVYKYSRPDDHFVNLPFIDPTQQNLFKDLRPDPNRHDILGAFRQRIGEIEYKYGSKEDKAVALCWLFHLVGEVHQPLHCATFYSAAFPKGDLGGNRFAVKIGGKGYKLHKFWDEVLGDVPGSDDDSAPRQGKLYSRIKETAETLRAPEYGKDQLPEYRENRAFPGWARESHEWAVKVGYRNGTLKGIPTDEEGNVPEQAPKADDDYETAARDLARKRAALAAHRLADQLKGLRLPKD